MKQAIHLGYEVGTGEAVEIPVRHMAVTGQTQESGKTTTLEALISRSELMAIAFVTKRGEGSFTAGRQIKPYFRERADSDFVRSILEAMMREKMKFERAWISKACKGAKSLADVQRNCQQLEKKAGRSLDQDMFMLLGEYLDKVVPLIASLPKSPDLNLARGLNVMDLSRYPLELQMLVISSTLQKIYEEAEGVITIIPECWEFVPQGRNSPVKLIVEKLIRKGAGLRNYIWLDSQDMAGVDKLLLRACAVWLVGVQRESNEVKRALGNMYGVKKPKADDVAILDLGQFFASYGTTLKKVYVQPAWMEAHSAQACAQQGFSPQLFAWHEVRSQESGGGSNVQVENAAVDGAIPGNDHQHRRQLHRGADDEGHRSSRESSVVYSGSMLQVPSGAADPTEGGQGTDARVQQTLAAHQKQPIGERGPIDEDSSSDARGKAARPDGESREEEDMPKTWTEDELIHKLHDAGVLGDVVTLRALIPILNGVGRKRRGEQTGGPGTTQSAPPSFDLPPSDLDGVHEAARMSRQSLIREVIAEIRKDPVLIRLSQEKPAIEVHVQRKTVKSDGATIKGKMALLIHEGFFQRPRSVKEIRGELIRRGMAPTTSGGFERPLVELVEQGFLFTDPGDMYSLCPGAVTRVVAA